MIPRLKARARGKFSAPACRKAKRPALQRARRAESGGQRRFVDPAVVFNDLLPDLAESNNDFAWACCPFHDDHKPSLSVNLRTGWYRCFSSSCGEAGGNIVGFVSALLALSPADARRHLERTYG